MKKKALCILLSALTVFLFAACGSQGGDDADAGSWSREGYYSDENDYMLSVTYMEDLDEPGWYVGLFIGDDPVDDSYSGTLAEDGGKLTGTLSSSGAGGDINVTISEEGEDGLLAEVEGAESYHFTVMDIPEAEISVTINTENDGNIAYAEGVESPEVDEEYPYQSAQLNLAEPATYTFLAWAPEGSHFVKWTKNGEDYSTDAQITVELDESADFIAVFDFD